MKEKIQPMKKLSPSLLTFCFAISLAGCQVPPLQQTSGTTSAGTSQTVSAAPINSETLSLSESETEKTEEAPENSESNANSTVYFTPAITPESLQAAYDALEWSPTGNLAVKVSTGEPPNSNYLRQELIGQLVTSLGGTYVECNTAYGGSRAETAMHKQVAEDHGFLPIDILDENDSMELGVATGDTLSGVNYVGANFANYDSMLVLSHFKGHGMAGMGGAIKNISIGLGSSMGKVWIHTGGERTSGGISGDVDKFQRAMAEAGLSVSDALGNGADIVYINVMNRLSVDCDCSGNPSEPDMHDIGILASTDPVALDKACLDLIYEAEGSESFVQRVESCNAILALSHGEEIGLGKQTYDLVSLR
jgi:uncharacterized Fe-S center protein